MQTALSRMWMSRYSFSMTVAITPQVPLSLLLFSPSLFPSLSLYIYIYIYVERERENKKCKLSFLFGIEYNFEIVFNLTLIGEILLFCRNAVGAFYSLSWLGCKGLNIDEYYIFKTITSNGLKNKLKYLKKHYILTLKYILQCQKNWLLKNSLLLRLIFLLNNIFKIQNNIGNSSYKPAKSNV